MKLTLSVGGGVTGLTKENTIDINTLDESTRKALMEYISSSSQKSPRNLRESWSLNDDEEVPIDRSKLNDKLEKLYTTMQKNLSYHRP